MPEGATVITGASAGVGRALAMRLAADGARLALIARDGAALEDAAREVRALGGEALVIPADVADAAAVRDAADEAARAFGGIDTWVNNAMVTVFGRVHEVTAEEFRRVTEVTYLGVVYGTQAALAHMRPANAGLIVQIGSALAYHGLPLQAAYCGAKHAITGFTDSLRGELIAEGSGVRVSAVHLPAVNTPQFDWARTHTPRTPRPAGTVYQPEAVADRIAEAIARPTREVWLGRETALVALGGALAPDLVDRYFARTAIAGQQTDEPVPAGRADNLLTPVHGRHRTRGRFGEEAEADQMPVLAPAPRTRAGAVAAAFLVAAGLGIAAGTLARR